MYLSQCGGEILHTAETIKS